MKDPKRKIKFSVVIPAYNRELEVIRAIKSCLNQTFTEFEIIVVDDKSTDNTLKILKSLEDFRINLVERSENGGVYAARKSGVNKAKGEWIVFLDSDDELLINALEIINNKINKVPEGIYKLGFMYCKEDGSLSPSPKFADDSKVIEYSDYISWTENIVSSDYCMCIKKETFKEVLLPERKSSFEALYHLDFSKKYNAMFFSEIVAKIHIEATNRSSNLNIRRKYKRNIFEAFDGLEGTELILNRHGDQLKKSAPNRYKMYRDMYIFFLLLCGERTIAFKKVRMYLNEGPVNSKLVIALILGLIHPRVLAYMNALRK